MPALRQINNEGNSRIRYGDRETGVCHIRRNRLALTRYLLHMTRIGAPDVGADFNK